MSQLTDTDEELLAAFVQGDRSCLAELARRYETSLLGLAAGLLGWQSDLACDAVQEAWVRVIRFAGRFDGASSFKTWIYRILMNQCRNIQAARPSPICPKDHELLANATNDPGHVIESAERQQVLRSAVQQLVTDKQAVLLLCYHEGMTHEQAAKILDVPLGTIKSRLHGALQELRTTLSPEVKP